MSVSVSMPQLGESVTEGTVTRWLKKEGERVERDEPLLEISTDKVDTEIPSPAAGILRSISVAEDETVAVGAQLAQIDEEEGAGQPAAAPAQAGPAAGSPDSGPGAASQTGSEADGPDLGPGAADGPPPGSQDGPIPAPAAQEPAAAPAQAAAVPPPPAPPAPAPSAAAQAAPAPSPQPQAQAQVTPPGAPPASPFQGPPVSAPYQPPASQPAPYQEAPPAAPQPSGPTAAPPTAQVPPSAPPSAPATPAAPAADSQAADTAAPSFSPGPDGPYVTPLVRKLAAEHGVDLGQVSGTGVGGRVRKQDVLDAARARRDAATTQAQQAPAPEPAVPGVPAARPAATAGRPDVVPSSLRGTTEHLSRLRQVIAQRMVESLQTSAQLTTVVEADVTAIARLRQRAKAEFEAREGVRLSFLPFFALAALEALKVHPKLNAVLDTQTAQVTYHDAEHLGVAVDTDRGLLVPVIRNAGDLNIGGLARKIADLAQRTRDGQVSPDELAGGTFTLTNTGSRGALFDTPIINQPQVAILGTGTVVKRPVVVEDPMLGEVIAVRSVVYLALTYDHRLIDGADAARFLATVKNRLEEGAFESELGL
jgi:pyruvate dehydrogenase E2 component (dihydrolipoamide acetyltransferase)